MNTRSLRSMLGAQASVIAICLTSAALTAAPGSAHAQAQARAQPEGATTIGEIVVTARKRDEALMNAPVTIQAFTAQKLDKLAITDLAAFSQIAPNLSIHPATGGVGAVAFLRGIGNGEAASFIDQSVLLNVDGVPQTHGAFMKSGLFDPAQVEVLKGPQALFFGKSSSAGIISIRSADPTAEWMTSIKSSYEFRGDEFRTEGIVSGPLMQGLGIRLAGYYNQLDGYFHNPAPVTSDPLQPNGKEYGGRITLRYDQGSLFNARFKFAKDVTAENGNRSFANQVKCTGTTPQKPTEGGDDCKLNDVIRPLPDSVPFRPDLNFSLGSPAFAIGSPTHLTREGRPYADLETSTGSLELNYFPTDGITVTSVTGYARVASQDGGRAPVGPSAGGFADVYGTFIKRDISQELRVASNYPDSKFNFMAGIFYATSKSYYESYLGLPAFTLFVDNTIRYKNDTYSAFGQITYNPIKELELSAGVRYTEVKHGLTSLIANNNYLVGTPPIPALAGLYTLYPPGEQLNLVPAGLQEDEANNLSPEFTVKYQMNPNLMLFASGKFGYKGPGYNVSTIATNFAPPNLNAPFKGEKVHGGEGGVKATLLDSQLQVAATAYWYNYTGLQVSFVDNNTFAFTTNNGADARIRGVEADVTYRPADFPGLTVNGFLNYNDGIYTSFPAATCYGGQTPAMGCRIDPVLGPVQDLGGHRLQRAPYWTGLVGLDYRRDVATNLLMEFTLNSNFSSGYFVAPEENPTSFQPGWITFDSSVSLGSRNGSWQVALITRNLTDKIYMTSGVDDYAATPGIPADILAYVNRPREIRLQVTLRPDLL